MARKTKAEQALSESEERYRLLVDNAAEGIIVLQDGKAVFHNGRAAENLGFTRQEFEALDLFALVHPEDRAMVLANHQARLRGEPHQKGYNLRVLDSQGRTRWVNLRAVVIDWEGRPATLTFITDINERKQAEEALRASEERYRSVVENVPCGLVIAELPSTRILFTNPAAASMFGYSEEEALELTIWDVTDPAEHRRARERIKARLEGGGALARQIYTGLRKDGSPVRYEVRISPIMHQGRLALQVVIQDVTEQERLENQVQHAQRMEAVGTLAGGVAHEFNNILMVIGGYAQLLDQGRHADPVQAGYARKINDSVKRAAELTKSLLSFSRRDNARRAPVNLNHLLEEMVALLRQTMPPNLELHLSQTQEDSPLVLGVRGQLEQVALNLALNARDAMPQGGSLTFRTRLTELELEFCRLYPWITPGLYAELSVQDSGQGMEPEVLDRVFEPFFTTKQPGAGTGLGLAVAYSIIKNHGGYIVAESSPGRGSLFRVLLPPLAQAALEDDPRPPDPAPPLGHGERVLVVDDEAEVRDICRQLLEKAGYRVSEAAQGLQALEAYQQARAEGRPFAVVILDLAMPVMDGRQCLERLRAVDPAARVILATGFGKSLVSPEEAERLAQGLLIKPYDLEGLLREVARALGPSRAA